MLVNRSRDPALAREAGVTAAGVSASGLATLERLAEAGECLHTVRGAIRVPREPG